MDSLLCSFLCTANHSAHHGGKPLIAELAKDPGGEFMGSCLYTKWVGQTEVSHKGTLRHPGRTEVRGQVGDLGGRLGLWKVRAEW